MRILHRIRHAIAWAIMPNCMRTPYELGSFFIAATERRINEKKKKEEKSDD
nr:MAG TPA: hypothetical protein [Caudoviricetes sp.]